LLPFHLEAANSWTARSWDRTQVPKPFSRVALVVGAPIEVPRNPAPDTLEAKRLELERTLQRLGGEAVRLLEAP
jgi:hypothetical protein